MPRASAKSQARRNSLDGSKVKSAGHVRIARPTPADYLAVMTRAVYQAGLSWAAIDRQWSALCDAFGGFEPTVVARYGATDIRRITRHGGILHSERKIQATIHNARALVAIQREYGSIPKFFSSLPDYDAAVAQIKERFSNVGDISVYYFLFRTNHKVPPFARWIKTVKGDHPRIAEMVAR
jgi:hypothetical protein